MAPTPLSPTHATTATRLAPRHACFLFAGLACLLELYVDGPALSGACTEGLFVFYQPVAHVLCMFWLWAAVVAFFERYRVRYEACFAQDHLQFLLGSAALFDVASVFTTALAISTSVYTASCRRGVLELAAYQPGLLFTVLALLLCTPVDFGAGDAGAASSYAPQRLFFVKTLRRVFVPIQEVAFTDFLLADILTSLAKPLSDLSLVACFFLRRRSIANVLAADDGFADGVCSSHALQIPVVLAVPYVLRFIQCVIVFRTQNDVGQFFNAIKYTTALPVVFLSFIKYSVPLTQWRAVWKPLWVAAAAVNTSYSFYWDVERDWDIRLFHKKAHVPFLRPEGRVLAPPALYFALIAINLVLRVSWTYKLSAHLRHLRGFVFAMTLLEVVRRFLWSFVRIEHELRKIQGRELALSPLVPQDPKSRKSSFSGAKEQELVHLSGAERR